MELVKGQKINICKRLGEEAIFVKMKERDCCLLILKEQSPYYEKDEEGLSHFSSEYVEQCLKTGAWTKVETE